MGRRLPDYDPFTDGPYATSKRRVQIFKLLYQHMEHWYAQQEDYGMSAVISTVDGEDVYYFDLMTGIDVLAYVAPQQYEAFKLICLEGYTESAATKVLLPNSKWSTPVQQYSDDGLKKMIAAYDAKQAGTWDPEVAKKRRRTPPKKKEDTMTVDTTSEVPEEPVDTGESSPKSEPRRWDWSTWSEDHESLAAYITAHGVDITAQQVKAVSFLRKQWYDDPASVRDREARREARHRERDKFADETPEQRKARHLAARKLRSYELAQKKLNRINAEIADLRKQAGLDPVTGEPLAE